MSASKLQPPESYSTEEIQEILYLAITRSTDKEELSRQQLWEIAAELDIDIQLIQEAEQDWLNQKQVGKKKQEFNLYRKGQLQYKVVRYLIVNVFLFSLNILSAGHLTWSLYILFGWGLKLSLETWKTLQTGGEAYERAFQNWKIKNEVKQSLTTLWTRLKAFWQSTE